MRWSVVSFLVSSLLLSSLPAAAAPLRPPTPADEARAIEVYADGGADAAVADGPRVPASPSTPSSGGRTSKPIALPSDYVYDTASTGPVPVDYYEGDGCSSSTDGYYSSDESDGTGGGSILVSGDDDDDDDDTTTSPSIGDDDDDDDDDDGWDTPDGDDDDDDDDTTKTSSHSPHLASKMAMNAGAHHRTKSPVSRLALFGALLAFPLRRRAKRKAMLGGHARRRHGSE